MACFVVPAATAVVTTVLQKVVERREARKRLGSTREQRPTGPSETEGSSSAGKWTRRLRWLNTMLWGGSALLALEHVWHGEVVPWPPFLTAMETPGQVGPMLHEMALYGTAMTVAVLVGWGLLVGAVELKTRLAAASHPGKAPAPNEEGL